MKNQFQLLVSAINLRNVVREEHTALLNKLKVLAKSTISTTKGSISIESMSFDYVLYTYVIVKGKYDCVKKFGFNDSIKAAKDELDAVTEYLKTKSEFVKVCTHLNKIESLINSFPLDTMEAYIRMKKEETTVTMSKELGIV